jgi:hypothetical protein
MVFRSMMMVGLPDLAQQLSFRVYNLKVVGGPLLGEGLVKSANFALEAEVSESDAVAQTCAASCR